MLPSSPGAPPPSGSTVCATGDPCVLTGQYNRYRMSVNVNETTLANFNSPSTFGLANFYHATSTPHTPFLYEPVVAQPLYVTNVPQSGAGTKNIVVVASLNDYVYAFDTGAGANPSPLWSTNLAVAHCTSQGVPFYNDHSYTPGGVASLPYYGIVATPAIDIAPNPPVAFVVSACTTSWNATSISWWLDAIELQGGTSLASAHITAPTFSAPYQLSRAALIITRPATGQIDVYVGFGTGTGEIKATEGSQYAYSGWLFGYSVKYSPSVSLTQLSSPFQTSGATGLTVFPAVYTGFDTLGGPLGPPCNHNSACDHGDNWAVNGGGIWMSGKGPATDSTASVYVTAGNGPFGCTGSGGTQECISAANVKYWGESVFEFPAATSTSMGVPNDFYAPNAENYTKMYPAGDPNPALYQTEELSRLDLDFGTAGLVLMPHAGLPKFAITADKSGWVYNMPAGTSSLGKFQTNDAGLTNQTVTTQPPFQASRSPYPNQVNPPCAVTNDTTYSGTCDEIHELAWFNDLLFVWPVNEAVEVFKGSFSNSNNTYSFPTTPTYDPCLTPNNCSGVTHPPFPAADPYSEGPGMALAADSSNHTTLWGVVPQYNSASAVLKGTFYAYTVNSDASLTHIWDTVTGHNCSNPPATGWMVPSFTEPRLAGGAAYVPSMCVVTDGNQYQTCSAVPSGSVTSGVLVYSTCP